MFFQTALEIEEVYLQAAEEVTEGAREQLLEAWERSVNIMMIKVLL